MKILTPLALGMMALSLITTTLAETLSIPGSGSPEYVLGELAKVFNSQQKQYQIVIPPTIGTAGGLRDVMNGTATIGRVGRPPSEAELSGGLAYRPLGRDAIAFVGGAGVSVRNVTRAQMVDVYTGELHNWRNLGGQPSPIRVIGRESTDSSLRVINREIKAFSGMHIDENVKIVHLDSQLIELLDRFPTGIGFLNRSALSAAKTKLVVLALDSVEPSAENVESGRYPIYLEFGLIYKAGALTGAGRAFLNFVESPAGVQVLHAHGVVPTVQLR